MGSATWILRRVLQRWPSALEEKGSAVSDECMLADSTRACAIDLHRKGIIRVECADESWAEGVTMRDRS